MSTGKTTSSARKWIKRAFKALGIASLVLVAVLGIAHFAWKYSGSNQWELRADKNGIKVYSLKSPGSTLEEFRAITEVKTTLPRALAPMVKQDLATCREWVDGCASLEIVKPWNSRELDQVELWRVDTPFPFSSREALLKTQVSQEPEKKAIDVDVMAVPDMLPRNRCCVRIERMHNSWQFTVQGNDELRVELTESVDAGVPYFLFNMNGAQGIYDVFSQLPHLLNEDKYQNENFEFLNAVLR